ncbi:MAG: glycosyltransferase family 2 protein [Pseudomonadales bacterium]|nr:glycosyltransferase family 2 protein [Pseudomonadales bacterium]
MLITKVIFISSILAIAYAYLLYPITLLLLSSITQAYRDTIFLFKKAERRKSKETEPRSVGVIIAAFNEEKFIIERINNLLEQSYPQDRLNIYIGSDGSDDKTAELANTIKAKNLHFFDFKERRGKVSVLNDLVSRANEDILVFSDANTMFDSQAISNLVRNFDQEHVGAAVGELVLYDANSKGNQDGAYWKYERFLKFHESRLNGLLGANGAIYAIRRESYINLPKQTLIDDFAIVMNVSRSGLKSIYEPEAIAYEEVSPSTGSEFVRRVRIGAGNYQALIEFRDFLSPKHKFRSFTFFSHKALRWLVPHFMVLALISNAFLLGQGALYTAAFIIQALVYSVCILMYKSGKIEKSPKLLQLVYFLVSMNVAFGFGFIRFLKGSQTGTWKRTTR